MPSFTMTYPYPVMRDGRRYEPGETTEAPENPDPNFFEETQPAERRDAPLTSAASRPSRTPVVSATATTDPEPEEATES